MKSQEHWLLRQHGVEVLYEDEHVLAVNKPPNLLVLPDRYDPSLPFLSGILKAAKGKIFVVHRIDKETSGLILFARTPEAHAALNHDFRKHLVRKTYLALVRGENSKKEGEIDLPIAPSRRERGKMIVEQDYGKESRTHYAILEEFNGFSLVEAKPESGRTHQIRVHLKYINHPILGDWQYAGRKTARDDRTWSPRVMLHAKHIEFTHPRTHQLVAIDAPVPDDMSRIIT